MPTLPTNPHSIGDSGHVNDHNTMNTALAAGAYISGNNITNVSGTTFIDKTKVAFLDTNILEKSDGTDLANLGAWTSYTPTLAQGTATNIGKTVTIGKYVQVGKTVHVRVSLEVTGTGQANNTITCTLPINVKDLGSAYDAIGVGTLYSPGVRDKFTVCLAGSAGTVRFAPSTTRNDDALGSAVMTSALSNIYVLSFVCSYEVS